MDFEWSVNEDLNGSDHYPIHFKNLINFPTECQPKWKVQRADWIKFREGVVIDRKFDSFESHLEAYEYLIWNYIEKCRSFYSKNYG